MSAAFMPPELESEQRESVLGRTNPLVKLGIALAWLPLEPAPTLRWKAPMWCS